MEEIKQLLECKDNKMVALQEQRLKLLQSGADLCDLSMINPDMAPDRKLIDALVQHALKPYNHSYSVSRGVRKLRVAFASKYKERFGVVVNPDTECVVTMGAKEAINLGLRALSATGKKVLIGSPTYPGFLSAAAMSGFGVEKFQIGPDEDLMLAEIESKVSSGTISLCLFNFPNNPSAITVSARFWEKIVALASRYDTFVINDFTYGEMCHSQSSPSLLSVTNSTTRLAEVYTLSKAYAVPGWRVGALLGSEELVSTLSQVKSYLDYGTFLPIQYAASFALTACAGVPLGISAVYQRRARLLVEGLRLAGWGVNLPAAGSAVWAKLPDTVAAKLKGAKGRSYIAAEQLLTQHNVFALPGEVFGEYPDFMRFALVLPEDRIRQLLCRFEHCEVTSQGLELRASL